MHIISFILIINLDFIIIDMSYQKVPECESFEIESDHKQILNTKYNTSFLKVFLMILVFLSITYRMVIYIYIYIYILYHLYYQ